MFNFKKIASVLSSAVMISSTVALAAAANYPAPFVSGGAANVAVVYGSTAAATDLVAVTDITSKLQASLASQTATGSTTTGGTVTGGNAYALFTSGTPIQLNTSINSVRSSVTDANLPTILADTEFTATSDTTDDSSITATHKIEIGSNPRAVFAKQPTSSDDPSLGILLGTTAANHLYNETVTFSKDVNFTDSDTDGEVLTLFGKRFTVAAATDATDLILFESAEKVFLDSNNPSQEVTVNGATYTVELVSASDTAANIRVTDSAGASDSKEINEASSSKIKGLEIAVDTADETNFKLSATIIAGASRVQLTDGSEVLIGTEEDPIEGTQVNFRGTVPDLKAVSVAVYAPSGSEDFFKAGDSFIDPVFGKSFKVNFAGLTNDGDREDIKVSNSGNDKMVLSFTNWQGKELTSWEWVNNESSAGGTAFLGGSDNYQLFVREFAKINESAFTVVGNEDEAYLVELSDLHNGTGTVGQSNEYNNDRVIFRNVFDITQTYTSDITAEGTGTVDIGGKTFTVTYTDDKAGNNDAWAKLNHPDSSGNAIVAYPSIQTGKGAKLMFYEPLTINLSDADFTDTSKNITGISIPDGDGYTSITVTPDSIGSAAGPLNYTITVGGGTATHINTTGAISSADGAIGPFTWNISSGFTTAISNNTVQLRLEDVDGTVINNPAILIIEEQDEDNNYNGIIIKTGGAGDTSSTGTEVTDVDFTWNKDTDMAGTAYGAYGLDMESDDDLDAMMDRWGTMVTTDNPSSGQATSTISYPTGQVTAEVYIAQADATITGSTSTGGTVKELGSVTVSDSEVSSVSTKNLVVVGGSCVNSVAASLLGGALCGADFESKTGVGAGSFLIETFSRSGGTVATLVAGYNAIDTTNAAKALNTQTIDTTAGKKYTGTSSTSVTLQTTAA